MAGCSAEVRLGDFYTIGPAGLLFSPFLSGGKSGFDGLALGKARSACCSVRFCGSGGVVLLGLVLKVLKV